MMRHVTIGPLRRAGRCGAELRAFSARAKRRHDKLRAARADPPALDAQLRQLYLRVHPDRFASSPRARAINEASLQNLTGFLDSIQDVRDGYPEARLIELKFCVRRAEGEGGGGGGEAGAASAAAPTAARAEDDVEDGLTLVRADLRTTGGDCSKQARAQLTELFALCGVRPPEFSWNKAGAEPKYWCLSRRARARHEPAEGE